MSSLNDEKTAWSSANERKKSPLILNGMFGCVHVRLPSSLKLQSNWNEKSFWLDGLCAKNARNSHAILNKAWTSIFHFVLDFYPLCVRSIKFPYVFPSIILESLFTRTRIHYSKSDTSTYILKINKLLRLKSFTQLFQQFCRFFSPNK